ncbi:MAG TPA: putative toxin-antitoxin system toxin component, PIN family, partial [Candidatus Eisenbacteria bacterium]|nr:putative toxin-antitoxin system toxin component, PIN family [Candidatus Eisenbacteria bacterium]
MSERAALRIVVDTNVYISGVISPHGSPNRLLRALRERRLELLLSQYQYAELVDVLTRPKFAQNERITLQELTDLLARLDLATRVNPTPTVPVPLRDPKDEPILAAALGGAADYLVTGDNDLLIHQSDPRLGNLRIVTVLQFLA